MNNKDIARRIRADYNLGNFTVIEEGKRVQFTLGNFTVRCKNSTNAVFNVVDKYDNNRGIRFYETKHKKPGPQRLLCKFSIKAFRDFAADGELDNAVEYCKGWGISTLPIEVQALVRSWA